VGKEITLYNSNYIIIRSRPEKEDPEKGGDGKDQGHSPM
jgi:hypothetical protein